MLALAWRAIDARRVALFAPSLLAQAGGQALFVACTAAFATQQSADPRRYLALAFVGVLVKMAGQTGASAVQAAWVARVGQRLRHAVLSGKSLHTPGHACHGLATEVPAEVEARVADVERGVGEGLLPTVRASVELAPLLALVLWSVPRFALVSIAVLLPFGLWLARRKKGVALALTQRLETRQRLLRAFDEAIRHDELWRVHGADHKVRALVHAAGAEQAAHDVRLATRIELTSGQNEALGVLFVWLCVLLAPDLSTAPGLLLRFLAAFFLTYKPLRQLVTARTALRRGRVALAALELADADVPSPAARAWPPGTLVLDAVELAHGTGVRLDLRVEPGQLWLVTGPSGCGKSTLLRTLLGLAEPRRGVIRYAGEVLTGIGPHARPLGWMSQACPIVGGSVEQALLLDGPMRAGHLLDGVRGDAHTLSGGEAQRVAFVRAISSAMPVLLLDEPTAHLDGATSDRLVLAIQAERARGRAFVVVTHEPERFAGLAGVQILSMQPADVFARGEAAE